ncbi:MAG: TadE/TadG family type IV pilus assembly protein [Bryobacteraceae bacterium]
MHTSTSARNGSRRTRARSHSESGSAIIEFALTILPLLGFVFLTMDIAWGIFAKASLQEAAREGVRFAVTCQILPPNTGLDASIRQVVQQYSFGFVTSANASSAVSIAYYAPNNLSTPVTGTATATAGGNIVQVSVGGISVRSFAPFLRTGGTSLNPSAIASDVMESSPGGIPCLE